MIRVSIGLNADENEYNCDVLFDVEHHKMLHTIQEQTIECVNVL